MAKVLGFSHGEDILVWSAADAIRLRKEWRVVGGLIGALPQRTRQNAHLGLPLMLSSEEAALLVEKGVLEIRDYVCPSPTTEEWGEAFDRMREQNFATQLADYQQKASEKLRKFTGTQTKSEALSSEQKTLESNQMEEKAIRHVEAADSCSSVEGTNPSSTGVESIDARLIQAQPLEQSYLPSTLVFAVPCLPGDSTGPSREGTVERTPRKGSCSFSPLVRIHVADPMANLSPAHFSPASWTYPRTELEAIRYKVFVDLWSRHYYITPGLKYGGDYLVYPGDPALVHSHYVAIIQSWTQAVSPLVSCGRIGTKVKKNTLLCSVDPLGAVRYFTWQWTGLA
ncbi:hypothetical protein EMCRGX_G014295 [Ephydatia muelleri]